MVVEMVEQLAAQLVYQMVVAKVDLLVGLTVVSLAELAVDLLVY